MTQPRNAIEWLMDQVRYESDIYKLRGLAIAAVMMIEDSDTIQDVFQQEMDESGYFDKETEHVSASDWLEDKEAWDMAIDLAAGNIKHKLGR